MTDEGFSAVPGSNIPEGEVPAGDGALVGSPFLKPGSTLRCSREMFLLTDSVGRNWLAIGPDEQDRPGGVMPHLLAGQFVTVQSTNAQGLIVRVPRGDDPPSEVLADAADRFAVFDAHLPAYLVPGALMPSFALPTSAKADTAVPG